MKSKLFLSLSLLTAAFSMNAGSLMVISNPLPTLQKLSSIKNAGLAASVLGGTGYVVSQYNAEQAELAKQAELANRSYLQVATDSLKSFGKTVSRKSSDLYKSVKATASDMYANATYENMKKASVDGFNSTKTFVQENPYKTAGGVAAVAALTYGAYKLYNSEMFAKSKAPVVTPTPAPVKKQVSTTASRQKSVKYSV